MLSHARIGRRVFLLTTTATAACGSKSALIVPDLCGGIDAGAPDSYAVGTHREFQPLGPDGGFDAVMVLRDERGFFAVDLACTHEGCIIPPLELAGIVQLICPCHRAVYTHEGDFVSFVNGRPLADLSHRPVRIVNGRLCVDPTRVEPDRSLRLVP